MKHLSSLCRKVVTFFHMEWKDKAMVFEVICLTLIARLVIVFIPFKAYKKYIGSCNEESAYDIDRNQYIIIRKVAWIVNTVSKYTPWQSKCLVKALTAQRMLTNRNIASTLYLGVNKCDNKMKAHAWLRCGQMFVTGGNVRSEFAEVAKFAM